MKTTKPGWQRMPGLYGGQCGAQYRLVGSKYRVIHCGHPTALWPYYVQRDGCSKIIIHPNGRAFQLLAQAKAMAEALAAGRPPLTKDELHTIWERNKR